MNKEKYIISSCSISPAGVRKDGSLLYDRDDRPLGDFLLSLYTHSGMDYPKFYKMDRLSKLGWLASEILLKDATWIKELLPEEVGIVLSNAHASLDTDIKYLATTKEFPSPAVFVYTLPNIMIGEISIRNNFKGENGFFIFDRFDAGFLEQYVSCLIDEGHLRSCICGWVDVGEEDYRAALFLVAGDPPDSAAPPGHPGLLFTKTNMDKIFMEDTL